MELRHLRYFIAVATELNFSRAAEALATAQPSLSQQIRQLEREIGFDLFDRTGRRIALTAAGVAFLAEARALVAQLETAVARTREAGRGMRGELRIAYTVSAMMAALPAAIRAYRAEHPDVRITLRAVAPFELAGILERRECDVGVLLAHADFGRVMNLDARRIGTFPMCAVFSEAHPLAKRRSIAVGEIGTATLVSFNRRRADFYDAIDAYCRAHEFVPARIEEVDRFEEILGLVAAGEGVSIVPRLYEQFRFPGLAYVALRPAPAPFALLAARSKGRRSVLSTEFFATCERLAAVASSPQSSRSRSRVVRDRSRS